jgi:UDP-N-acetylglucosamine 2-epimerase (non-hydrolysing)
VTYRELFYFLVWCALKVRYKQTALGFAWDVLRRRYEFAKKNLAKFGLLAAAKHDGRLVLIQLAGISRLPAPLQGAWLVLTDSGSVQEETTTLGIPCLTLRENTERHVTVKAGTNRDVISNPEKIVRTVDDALGGLSPRETSPRVPQLWDGKTAARILDTLG